MPVHKIEKYNFFSNMEKNFFHKDFYSHSEFFGPHGNCFFYPPQTLKNGEDFEKFSPHVLLLKNFQQ